MLRRQFLLSLLVLPLTPPLLSGAAGWDPLADPRGQPGLLWHNDWSKQYGRADVNQGSWVRALGNRGELYAPFQLEPGRFTSALAWREKANGAICYPSNGVLPADNFWFGMWMHLKKDMEAWEEPGIISLGNAYQKIALLWNPREKIIFANALASQGGILKGGGPKFKLPVPLPVTGDWMHLGLRVAGGEMTLYLNGRPCTMNNAQRRKIPIPLFDNGVMDSALTEDGIVPMYSVGKDTPQTGFACSDLCLFAGAPEPGGRGPSPLQNRLSVNPATTPQNARLDKRMLGGCQLNKKAPDAAKLLKGTLGSLRMAALMLASPIEPTKSDVTPLKGPSPYSRWFWDTTILHQTLDWCFSCADELLLDLGGVPSALQDPRYPRSDYPRGAAMTNRISSDIPWKASLPNWKGSNAEDSAGRVTISEETANAYAEAATDLYLLTRDYCQKRNRDFRKIRWAFWNEPDEDGFWPGKKAFADRKRELWKLLAALVRHARAADPDFRVDAAGFVGTNNLDVWLPSLFEDAKRNGYTEAIRAVHYHAYNGLSAETLEYALRLTERLRSAAGMPRPLPVLLGEYAWTAVRMLGTTPDWPQGRKEYAWGCGAWQAAQIARMTIYAARLQGLGGGVESLHLYSCLEYTPLGPDFGATGFIHRADVTPHATLNALRLLRKMTIDDGIATRHGATIWRGVPGVAHLCSVLPNGTIRILLARQAWRAEDEIKIAVELPKSHAGRRVTRFVVNDRHSSQYDAGPTHTELETVPQEAVTAEGLLHFPMRGHEVTLLEIIS